MTYKKRSDLWKSFLGIAWSELSYLWDYIARLHLQDYILWDYIARHPQRHRANEDLQRLTKQSYDRYNNYDDEDEDRHDGYDSYDDGDGDGDSYRSVGWNQVYSFQVKVKS